MVLLIDPCIHPCSKVIRISFCNVNWWYLFSMYRFETFRVAWWGVMHFLEKISWMYIITACPCEHSNLVRFEKCSAKTPQDGHWYGNVLMNDTLNTYEWFFFYNWHELTFPSNTVFWSNTLFKYQTWMSSNPIPAILICKEQCRRTQEGEPAHISYAEQYSDMILPNILR